MIDNLSIESEIFEFKIRDITRRPSLSRDERMQGILELGRKAFDLPIGIISHIAGQVYTVLHAATPTPGVKPGDTFELGVTYCVHTLKNDGPTAFTYVSDSELRHHPCFKTFKMETYIGAPIVVNGRRFGTVNFSSPLIRSAHFLPADLKGIAFMAEAVGELLAETDGASD